MLSLHWRTSNSSPTTNFPWLYPADNWTEFLSPSLMLRPTASRPVCLGTKHPSGTYDQFFITVRWLRVCWCGSLSLWREDESVIYNCFWPSPAQSLSRPSPVGFAAVFYCLWFKTSLFVASYHSQGHGGGIWPRLYTGYNQYYPKVNSHSHILYILLARTTHIKHMSCDRYALLWYDVIAYVQAARTQRTLLLYCWPCMCCGHCLAMDLHVTIIIPVCCDKSDCR
jgi:hypothetical protein